MNEVTLESAPAAFREFVLALPRTGDDMVITYGGKPVVTLRTTPADPTGVWTDARNDRRCDLIDKEVAGTITPTERAELESLQAELRRFRRRVAPLPNAELRELLEALEQKEAAAS